MLGVDVKSNFNHKPLINFRLCEIAVFSPSGSNFARPKSNLASPRVDGKVVCTPPQSCHTSQSDLMNFTET